MRALQLRLLPILALVGVCVAGAGSGAGPEGCPPRCTCAPNGTVRCVFQKLTRVPKVPPSTAVLDLRFNNIAEVIPGVLGNLAHLHTLMLNDNRLRRLHASTFSGARNLRYLYLYKNRIGYIEPGTFKDLPRLEQLYLHGNELRELAPGTFSNLPKLERLYLQNNHLEKLPAEAFENVGPMTKLRLDSNALVCDCKMLWLLEKMRNRMTEPASAAVVCQAPDEMKGRRLGDMTPDDFHCSRPVIMEGPEDRELKRGQRAVFRCRVAGDPRPRIKWMRDSNEVPSDDEHYAFMEDGSLVINEVTERDAGDYECVAQNDMGYTKSRAARTLVAVAQVPVAFIETPRSQTVSAGTDVVLVCRPEGDPRARIEWWRNGSRIRTHGRIFLEDDARSLKILAVKESDSARYVCQARGPQGFAEVTADLNVLSGDNTSPRLIFEPQDMEIESGTIIELPCRAEGHPRPNIIWRKDGSALEGNKTRISKHGSLYIYNVTSRDTGRYECMAVNDYGRASAGALVRVRQPMASDVLVIRAFSEATREIDQAINNTLLALFEQSGTRPDPFRLSRFPDAVARRAARPAELFERALLHIRRLVESGRYANATEDFRYDESLTLEQVAELERLSGCTSHQRKDECQNQCFHSHYRTFSGKCNNLENPTWGASYTSFRRILRPLYENGFSQPIGWDKARRYYGYPKPPARLVSTSLILTEDISYDTKITHMVMQWGQWIDHDFDHALPAVSSESWGGINCKKSCENVAPCFPIEVPPGDQRIKNRRCIDFFRTSAVCGSGMTSILLGKLTPREQLNQLTSYLDASQVYGYDDKSARELRDFSNELGLLREGPSFPGSKPLLPYANDQFIDCRRNLTESTINCFLAGDFRVNEQIGLTVMHTIWMREHNRIARRLRVLNPHWSGEKLYQEARKIVGAQMQVITYRDWIPLILGERSEEAFGPYRGYDKHLDGSISNVFATAALRFGHALIQPNLERLDENFEPIPEGPLALRDAFFAPWRLVEEGGVDPLIRGMYVTPAKLKRPEENLNPELIEQLFRTAHAVALDLAAMNIQRGRDHAIPPYVDWRRYCNMSEIETFDDLANEIGSPRVRQKLRELYGHPGNIDVWVGGILEDQLPDAKVGPLFKCLLSEQFQRMRDSDRFWHESPTSFPALQLEQIKRTSLARVLCDNADNITSIQANVFLLPEYDNDFLPCDQIPSIDLTAWTACCEECLDQRQTNNDNDNDNNNSNNSNNNNSNNNNNNNDVISRSRRSTADNPNNLDNQYTFTNEHGRTETDGIRFFEDPLNLADGDYQNLDQVLNDLRHEIAEMNRKLNQILNYLHMKEKKHFH